MDKPTIICLTPVRNEEWILERFLRCTSLWADLIILADQGSTDGTLKIASQFPKVRVIQNETSGYDERFRQQLLITAARRMVSGPRLLVALDADEALTANYAATKEWRDIIAASPGTVIRFRWVNLRPGCRQGWLSQRAFPWGFMDDGTDHSGREIHSPRVPVPPGAREIVCDEIKVLHYQYTDPDRMESKHRWYQCFERVKNPAISAVKLFDQYHHMHRIAPEDLIEVKSEWLEGYQRVGIDMTSANKPADGIYWWDPLLLAMIQESGSRFFAREDIWRDLPRIARQLGADPALARDPRTGFEKIVHRLLISPASMENRFWAKQAKSLLKKIGF